MAGCRKHCRGSVPPAAGCCPASAAVACRRGPAAPRAFRVFPSRRNDLTHIQGASAMTLKIRLARGGAKKRPYYRIVVADSNAPRDGRFIEKIGSWNPILPKGSPDRVTLDAERAKHWLSVGAQPTDRVARFLDASGL